MPNGRLMYGFDPLCGWCYGFVPAMRSFRERHPDVSVDLVLGGLVTGDRVGPYREMILYIRGASERLEAVTGRRPSDAFFERIGRADTVGSSTEPSIVIADVLDHEGHGPGLLFAHDVIEAHFEAGVDLNDRDLYERLYREHGIARDVPPFDESNRAAMARRFQGARELGIDSFPTVIALREGDGPPAGRYERLPSLYEPRAFVAAAERALGL